jgi:hypothetical protein
MKNKTSIALSILFIVLLIFIILLSSHPLTNYNKRIITDSYIGTFNQKVIDMYAMTASVPYRSKTPLPTFSPEQEMRLTGYSLTREYERVNGDPDGPWKTVQAYGTQYKLTTTP